MSQLMDSAIAKQFERLPPHSVEEEMCLLASMMLDVSKDAVGQIVQIVDEESFFQADHSILFKVLKNLYDKNRPIDAMIVREELIKGQLLEEIGGIEYLAAILSAVPNAGEGSHYAGVARGKAPLGEPIAGGRDVLREADSRPQSARRGLEKGGKKIFGTPEEKVAG